jgi:hypothetical protein
MVMIARGLTFTALFVAGAATAQAPPPKFTCPTAANRISLLSPGFSGVHEQAVRIAVAGAVIRYPVERK